MSKNFKHLTLEEMPGDVVYFVFPNSGQDWEQKEVESLLELGRGYEIKEMYVGDFNSKVVLEEFPDIKFNTVFFGVS